MREKRHERANFALPPALSPWIEIHEQRNNETKKELGIRAAPLFVGVGLAFGAILGAALSNHDLKLLDRSNDLRHEFIAACCR